MIRDETQNRKRKLEHGASPISFRTLCKSNDVNNLSSMLIKLPYVHEINESLNSSGKKIMLDFLKKVIERLHELSLDDLAAVDEKIEVLDYGAISFSKIYEHLYRQISRSDLHSIYTIVLYSKEINKKLNSLIQGYNYKYVISRGDVFRVGMVDIVNPKTFFIGLNDKGLFIELHPKRSLKYSDHKLQKINLSGTKKNAKYAYFIQDLEHEIRFAFTIPIPKVSEYILIREEYAASLKFDFPSVMKYSLSEPYYNSQGEKVVNLSSCYGGQTLSTILSENKIDEVCLSEFDKFAILIQVMLGLAHIHQAGYVMEDMKPMNIVITRLSNKYPSTKLIDFGLTKPYKSKYLSVATKYFESPRIYALNKGLTIKQLKNALPNTQHDIIDDRHEREDYFTFPKTHNSLGKQLFIAYRNSRSHLALGSEGRPLYNDDIFALGIVIIAMWGGEYNSMKLQEYKDFKTGNEYLDSCIAQLLFSNMDSDSIQELPKMADRLKNLLV